MNHFERALLIEDYEKSRFSADIRLEYVEFGDSETRTLLGLLRGSFCVKRISRRSQIEFPSQKST